MIDFKGTQICNVHKYYLPQRTKNCNIQIHVYIYVTSIESTYTCKLYTLY